MGPPPRRIPGPMKAGQVLSGQAAAKPSMLLRDKVAVFYGAGGAIGEAVAHEFAREGAHVFLTGRHLAPIEVVAEQIAADGGNAEAAEVDALDERAIEAHLGHMIDEAGRIDISFNAVGVANAEILGVP